jgi:hypothetical protein
LEPLAVAALQRHRADMELIGLYQPEGFVFCGTPFLLANLRRYFRALCERVGLGSDWTFYGLRHSFVSLVFDQLDDLVKGGRRPCRPRGHQDDPGLPPRRAAFASSRHRGVGRAAGQPRQNMLTTSLPWGCREVGVGDPVVG